MRLVAGWPLISRSAASTPVTSSLKVTSIRLRARTVAPPFGKRLATAGGTTSTRVYCQEAPGAVASNGLGGEARSVMPWAAAQPTVTPPYGGGRKVKVYMALLPVTPVAARPLM